jgi:hypothetical protein
MRKSRGVLLPILHIKSLPLPDPSVIEPTLVKTCVAIARICNCSSNDVSATYEQLSSNCYVVGRVAALHQPPFCELICSEGLSSVEIEELMLVTAQTIGEGLGVGTNVYVRYLETKPGLTISSTGIVR